nr:uncharacterized protein LOC123758435 isoform X1 [Procambarus clarkii]
MGRQVTGVGQAVRATLHLLVILVWVLAHVSCVSLIAMCPPAGPGNTSQYCRCERGTFRSGRNLTILCDFNNKEDVVLSSALYPFRRLGLMTAYVRIMNAISVLVTEDFLLEWLTVPSVGLDLWECGRVTVVPTPWQLNPTVHGSFSTFVGVGIVGCIVPYIPTGFLRDKTAAGLRISRSTVGVLNRGFLSNIREMRYLVLEDSTVDFVDGPVASEGFVTLSNRTTDGRNGLVLSNVTIQRLGNGAFNLIHQNRGNGFKMEMLGCYLGQVGTGAFTVTGDIAVTIKANRFRRLEKEAFKIDVARELKFEENVALSVDRLALAAINCHNLTSLERNTVHLDTMPDPLKNSSVIPFHVSCGNPQIFTVISPAQPRLVEVTSIATWVLLAILLLFVLVILIYVVFWWRSGSNQKREYRKNDTFHFFNGLRSSKENLTILPDLNMTEVPAGVSNPLYDKTEPSCSK